jgi:general secretion pathway protein G
MNATRRKMRRGEGGFSLIELMVVIAIIAMLAAIVGFNVMNALGKGETAAAKAQIKQFQTALTSYRLTLKKFPTTEQGLQALIDNEKGEKFLDQKEIPDDPWGNPYMYRIEDGNPVIVSYGADGQQGGDGENEDISSDNLTGSKDK